MKNMTDNQYAVNTSKHGSASSPKDGATVSGRTWFVALLTHQKYTDSCVSFLEKNPATASWDVYIPRKKVLHVYANRTKRKVDRYFIPRMLFVSGMEEGEAYEHVRNNPYIEMFLPERALPRTTVGRLQLAQVPDADLQRLRRTIEALAEEDDLEITKERLTSDSVIEVCDGHLSGLYGNYVNDADNHFLCFALGRLGNVKVKVDIKRCILHKEK